MSRLLHCGHSNRSRGSRCFLVPRQSFCILLILGVAQLHILIVLPCQHHLSVNLHGLQPLENAVQGLRTTNCARYCEDDCHGVCGKWYSNCQRRQHVHRSQLPQLCVLEFRRSSTPENCVLTEHNTNFVRSQRHVLHSFFSNRFAPAGHNRHHQQFGLQESLSPGCLKSTCKSTWARQFMCRDGIQLIHMHDTGCPFTVMTNGLEAIYKLYPTMGVVTAPFCKTSTVPRPRCSCFAQQHQ
mmetsp:Transcript_6632/g.12015  ORF Transcript_6632/g.12015 Transcript_6632/m.12015 type:complete len:240 (+) Transcript_6632:326-1045(+)